MPKNHHPRHAGAKPLFTRHVSNGLFDLRAIRKEIEKAQEIGERPGANHKARVAWRRYRDLMEGALDVRIDLLDADVDSHEKAIDGAGCPVLCRAGVQTNPSSLVLRQLAGKQMAAGGAAPTAA